MCGIAGFAFAPGLPPEERRARHGERLRRMVDALGHRGPDDRRGVLLDGMALGHARLAIVDAAGGRQPMRDPATGVTLVFNGEIFDHLELRARLARGYAFRTRSDTEVLLAAWLARGPACLEALNGQFAFALWDPRSRELWLARDRVGICPLHHALAEDGIAFASEAKALFAAGVPAALDPVGVKECFQLWAPVAPRTCFEGVRTLPPGTVARVAGGRMEARRWWQLELGAPGEVGAAEAERGVAERIEDAVRIRLRADVPVAAYLSGGLDSSLVCAVAQRALGGTLRTFSVAFADAGHDERAHQQAAARHLGTAHRTLDVEDGATGALIPAAVEHGEQVLLRSAPGPFLALSRFVRDEGVKVVLTGEGADEAFLGYDLFKETRIRRFWARRPESLARAALLSRIHPTLAGLRGVPIALMREFWGTGLDRPDRPDFSHLPRWAASARVSRFCSEEFLERTRGADPGAALLASLGPRLAALPPMARAQALEMETLLSGYLLSAQGDRMIMAHGVEGRFPFLDHRVLEWAARLPDRLKLRGLEEKWVLRRWAARLLPPPIAGRTKFPYRAPVAAALAGPAAPAWTEEAFASEALRAVGVFDAGRVARLRAKVARSPAAPTEADAAALMAVASTQLLARAFVGRVASARPGRVALEAA